jgi:hypothetical protein
VQTPAVLRPEDDPARLPLATNSVMVWQQTGLRLSWNVTAEGVSPSLPQRFFARAASTRRPGTSSVWSFRNIARPEPACSTESVAQLVPGSESPRGG